MKQKYTDTTYLSWFNGSIPDETVHLRFDVLVCLDDDKLRITNRVSVSSFLTAHQRN